MQSAGNFWRNVATIGVVHVALLAAVIRWSGAPVKPPASNILWMDGGAALQDVNIASVSQTTTATPQIIEAPPVAEPEEQAAPELR
ncbi:MAG: hypothetical protein M3Y69_07925, partial [Verrucomicrobiota bacterium]|nr:hypothetical protein [Verrucomicrobiota bacterium]